MRLGIMQPYFFPYLGYWQLINSVDKFIIYDNIEYSKKGWINRNNILLNDKSKVFTVPLKKDSDYLTINKRFLSDNANKEIKKVLGQIRTNYSKAPFFTNAYSIVEKCFNCDYNNLFDFIYFSIEETCRYLNIKTSFVKSSDIKINHSLKGDDKVLQICNDLKAEKYINPIGGIKLYSKEKFNEHGIDLYFLKMNDINYAQFSNEFVPSLSIIDVMMFNSKEDIHKMLRQYTLI